MRVNKRFLLGAIAALAVASLALLMISRWRKEPAGFPALTDQEFVKEITKLRGSEPTPLAPLPPLDLTRPLRLAIGGLGPADDEQNRRVGDLVAAELTGAPGLELVERSALDAVLREMSLSLSGLVRARDAIRVGQLLRADWFLLGTIARLDGTNTVVVRLVDARTGILRDAGRFAGDQPPPRVASDLAAFVRQSRKNAAGAKSPVYLAIGGFRDLGVNNRQAEFPAQLRAYLTAAYQGSGVTLVEREYVETLRREVLLDLAGLTEAGGTNAPAPMQSAYWLVDGDYQSFENSGFEVELVLEITGVFRRATTQSFRGRPGEVLFGQIKRAVDTLLNQNTLTLVLSLKGEINSQLVNGRRVAQLTPEELERGWSYSWDNATEQDVARMRRNAEEAIRAFQTVLLLDPANREARICLAACFRQPHIDRTDEACDLYREVLEAPVEDRWSRAARLALERTFEWADPAERSRWYGVAGQQSTNASAIAFYRAQTDRAREDIVIQQGGSRKAEELSTQRLFEAIRSSQSFLLRKVGTTYHGAFGMYAFADSFGTNRSAAADALVELLPRMQTEFPGLIPHLVAEMLAFQVRTNIPLVAEFERQLDWCAAHPDQVFQIDDFWNHARYAAFHWCCQHRLYPLAIKVMQSYRGAVEGKLTISRYGDRDKVALAFAYQGANRWQEALEIYEGLSAKSVMMTENGPWGRAWNPVVPGKLADVCRDKLGLSAALQRDPRQFEMETNGLCLHAPSAFAVDSRGLWIAIEAHLIHLSFDLRTNLLVALPNAGRLPVTSLCVGPSHVWVGTEGAGLIEYDKTSGRCRRFTEKDGLLMDSVSQLCLSPRFLWIGFRSPGLGQLDLQSSRLRSFVRPLDAREEAPPSAPIAGFASCTPGQLWVFAGGGVQRYQMTEDRWVPVPKRARWDQIHCFAADPDRLILGVSSARTEIDLNTKLDTGSGTSAVQKTTLMLSQEELAQLQTQLRTNRARQWISRTAGSDDFGRSSELEILALRDAQWQRLQDTKGLPNPPTLMTLAGSELWVGGQSYITLVDLAECRVRKFAYVTARNIDQIHAGGGYVWAKYDRHLHRAAINISP
jgi:hypothetical protein